LSLLTVNHQAVDHYVVSPVLERWALWVWSPASAAKGVSGAIWATVYGSEIPRAGTRRESAVTNEKHNDEKNNEENCYDSPA